MYTQIPLNLSWTITSKRNRRPLMPGLGDPVLNFTDNGHEFGFKAGYGIRNHATRQMKPTLQSLFPNASVSCHAANPQLLPSKANKTRSAAIVGAFRAISHVDETPISIAIQNAESEYHKTATLGSAVQREAKSLHRTIVRFIGYRVRCLDPDNFAGGCKDLLDGLRHALLIPGDEPWRINFETRQEKVAHRSEEKTVIELEYPF
jgi:hypothetical protein